MINVLDEGALGNASHYNGGGQDDTPFFQRAFEKAALIGNDGVIGVPGGRTYRWTRGLVQPLYTRIVGLGSRNRAGIGLPSIVWDGPEDGTILSWESWGNNFFSQTLENVCLRGRSDGVRQPAHSLVVRGIPNPTGGKVGAAKPDSESGILNVWHQSIRGDAVLFDNAGATNFTADGGRFDAVGGYAWHFNLNGGGKDFIGRLGGQTYDTNNGGQGYIFFDAESATINGGGAVLSIDYFHSEVNLTLATTGRGSKPYDLRSLIRCGVNPASYQMHQIDVRGWTASHPFTVAPYALFGITAAAGVTAEAAQRCVYLKVDNVRGVTGARGDDQLGCLRPVGGLITDAARYPQSAFYSFEFVRGARAARAEGYAADAQAPEPTPAANDAPWDEPGEPPADEKE